VNFGLPAGLLFATRSSRCWSPQPFCTEHGAMDPKEKLVSIIMMQGANGPLQRDFENAVQQAIVE